MTDTLERIREVFAEFEEKPDRYTDPKTIKGRINAYLNATNTNMSVLDPSGKATAQEMEERFHRAVTQCYIASARRLFDLFVKSRHGVEHFRRDLRERLRLADADMSVLDASGKNTAEEMEKKVEQLVREGWLHAAHLAFSQLEKTDSSTSHCLGMIRKGLNLAEADTSALDPSGKSTTEEMEKILNDRAAAAHLREACREFDELERTGTAYDPEKRAKEIRKHISEAEADISALDVTGQRSKEEMERYFEWVVAAALINSASESLRDRRILSYIRSHLEIAGAEMPAITGSTDKEKLETFAQISDALYLTEFFNSAMMGVRRGGISATKALTPETLAQQAQEQKEKEEKKRAAQRRKFLGDMREMRKVTDMFKNKQPFPVFPHPPKKR